MRPWSNRWDRSLVIQLVLSGVIFAAVIAGFGRFMLFVEARPGTTLADPVLALFRPIDVTWVTFIVLYAGLGLALVVLADKPQRFLRGIQTYSMMVLLRAVAMWLVPLEAPPAILLLEDPFVRFFGPSEIITKDLFFSGHTASMVIFAVAVQPRWARWTLSLGAVVVGACVLLQHVHYTIDVVAAPAFAWLAWCLVGLVRTWLRLPEAP